MSEFKEAIFMAHSLDYFYGYEADQFSFYRIPKILIQAPEYKDVSDGAKILYGLMLDRMGLSIKNGWIDEENKAYIYFTTNDVKEQMNCCNDKAIKMLAELDSVKGVGLIERKKQGQGKPSIVYLKKFITSRNIRDEPTPPNNRKQDFCETEFKSSEKQNSRIPQSRSAEFCDLDSNYTNINKNKINNTDFNDNHITSYPIEYDDTPDAIRWMREREEYEEIIKENIEYDIMVDRFSPGWLDEIVEIMVDVVCSNEPFIRVNKQNYPKEAVKSRFLKIDSSHIEYISDALKNNTSNVRNIRAFLITTIYRAPETTDNWYAAKVNYDLKND